MCPNTEPRVPAEEPQSRVLEAIPEGRRGIAEQALADGIRSRPQGKVHSG